MKKLSLLLALCLLTACLASCGGDKTDAAETGSQATTTTAAAQTTEAPTEEETTKEPEVPQDDWTARY